MTISWWLLLQNTFWAGIAALGFAILFNVPVRTLFACAFGGAAGYAVRTLLTASDLASVEAATLASSILVAFLGVAAGRRWHAPAPVFIVPGVIPLVPGSLAFRTMIGILTLVTGDAPVDPDLLSQTTVDSIRTILIVGAMVGGIALPRLLLRRHRPMT